MAQFQQESFSNHTIEQLYNLVLDIEKYPEFLPWCTSAQVIEKSDSKIIADLTINFKGLSEQYRSSIQFQNVEGKTASIAVTAISGPFKHLINNWFFERVNDTTNVKFFINFEFKSVLFDKLIGIFFSMACKKMIDAFEERAKELYD